MKHSIITGTASKLADGYAMGTMGIPSLQLMETASRAVSDFVAAEAPGCSVIVASGVGNNGADGLCAARFLKEQGFSPAVYLCGDLRKGTWEFFRQLSEWKKADGKLFFYEEGMFIPHADVLVDAVFGIGLKRPVGGAYRDFLDALIASAPGRTVAVDAPSGINTDTGELMGIAVRADDTVTFGRNKTGLVTGAGIDYAGQIHVVDIGIPDEAYDYAVRQ